MIFPLLSTTPNLSPSPSNAKPKSHFFLFTNSTNCFKFFGIVGSGWWAGKFPSIFSFITKCFPLSFFVKWGIKNCGIGVPWPRWPSCSWSRRSWQTDRLCSCGPEGRHAFRRAAPASVSALQGGPGYACAGQSLRAPASAVHPSTEWSSAAAGALCRGAEQIVLRLRAHGRGLQALPGRRALMGRA